MSGSLVGRALRPVVLLVTGMFIAQTTVSVAAGAVSPNATQERSVSCAGANFHTLDPLTQLRLVGRLMTRLDVVPADTNGEPTAGFFACDVSLPNKAEVTKVQFTLRDSSAQARLQYCGLDRSSLKKGSAGSFQTLAQVPTTGMADKPGTVRQTDSTIEHATVDNTEWVYWLQCRIELDGLSTTPDAGIYGADVIYRISSANG